MIQASDINISDDYLLLSLRHAEEIDEEKEGRNAILTFSNDSSQSPVRISDECYAARPKTIKDLTDGFSLQAVEFKKSDEAKLSLFGFMNVNFDNVDKVVVVEYAQTGTQYCEDKEYKYGVGARMMMKVKKIGIGGGAKLNSPHQITASVIFGKASVTFDIQTFGITGPGVNQLIQAGNLSEDTYSKFLQIMSYILTEAYKDNGQLIVVPKPIFT